MFWIQTLKSFINYRMYGFRVDNIEIVCNFTSGFYKKGFGFEEFEMFEELIPFKLKYK